MSLVKDVAIGTAAGMAGLQALSATSNYLYDRTPDAILRQEKEIEYQEPFEILASRLADVAGVELDDEQKQAWIKRIDLALATGMGVAYVAAGRRWPLGWLSGGLTLGALYFLLLDEGVSPVLGLVGDNRKYPWQSHARGLAAHLAFGVAAGAMGAVLGVRGHRSRR